MVTWWVLTRVPAVTSSGPKRTGCVRRDDAQIARGRCPVLNRAVPTGPGRLLRDALFEPNGAWRHRRRCHLDMRISLSPQHTAATSPLLAGPGS
jgi:hypothetical protein